MLNAEYEELDDSRSYWKDEYETLKDAVGFDAVGFIDMANEFAAFKHNHVILDCRNSRFNYEAVESSDELSVTIKCPVCMRTLTHVIQRSCNASI